MNRPLGPHIDTLLQDKLLLQCKLGRMLEVELQLLAPMVHKLELEPQVLELGHRVAPVVEVRQRQVELRLQGHRPMPDMQALQHMGLLDCMHCIMELVHTGPRKQLDTR